MLFSTFEFLFVFLPVVVVGFVLLAKTRWGALSRGWLVFSSFVFYAVWRSEHIPLLAGSILANYFLGLGVSRARENAMRRILLILGVGLNLGLLAYFKYAGFFAGNLQDLGMLEFSLPAIALPLGISFFTFQQIAYLLDVSRERRAERNLLNYAFFVSFFPQLVAGPIVHHREMLSQLRRSSFGTVRATDLAVGLSLLTIGLAKKLLIADQLGLYADPVFAHSDGGGALGPLDAWIGLLAYTGQLYFDFSGYCDMATGLARMFGLLLPLNFFSPYKAGSIIEFWRRWHITLSRFLRDSLYIPLGGNRVAKWRHFLNLGIVMFLGGLWHGAAWTFAFWGLLHGFYLAANNAWRGVLGERWGRVRLFRSYRVAAWALTISAVMVAWAFFRAGSFGSAGRLLGGLVSSNGESKIVEDPIEALLFALAALALCLLAPNSMELWRRYRPAIGVGAYLESMKSNWSCRLNFRTAAFTAALLVISCMRLMEVSPFLYFEF